MKWNENTQKAKKGGAYRKWREGSWMLSNQKRGTTTLEPVRGVSGNETWYDLVSSNPQSWGRWWWWLCRRSNIWTVRLVLSKSWVGSESVIVHESSSTMSTREVVEVTIIPPDLWTPHADDEWGMVTLPPSGFQNTIIVTPRPTDWTAVTSSVSTSVLNLNCLDLASRRNSCTVFRPGNTVYEIGRVRYCGSCCIQAANRLTSSGGWVEIPRALQLLVR